MQRYAIPLAGLLLVVWACSPPAPPPPPPAPTPVTLTSVACPPSPAWPSGGDLLTHVQYVQLTPQPNTDFTFTVDLTPIDAHIQRDLAAAFTANQQFSINELCSLDRIFINRQQCINPGDPSDYDPSNCSLITDTDIIDNSWGLRTPLPVSKKYVTISLGLWRCQSGRGYCAPTFTEFHERLNKALLDRTACKSENPPCRPAKINRLVFQSSPDTSGLSILSALAHERGHIRWWETFVQPPGSTPRGTDLISRAGTFCSGAIYPKGYWQGVAVGLPNNRYVQFGDLSPNSQVHDLPKLLHSSPDGAVALVDRIYLRGQYPSLLAAYSPDEDFVEAFEWSVLRNARLSELSVNIAGTPRPILQRGRASASGAEAKLQCFDPLSRARQQQR